MKVGIYGEYLTKCQAVLVICLGANSRVKGGHTFNPNDSQSSHRIQLTKTH